MINVFSVSQRARKERNLPDNKRSQPVNVAFLPREMRRELAVLNRGGDFKAREGAVGSSGWIPVQPAEIFFLLSVLEQGSQRKNRVFKGALRGFSSAPAEQHGVFQQDVA